MTPKNIPNFGDWLKLVESLALKRHDEYGKEVHQGDFFRFLGLSAAEGYCECYCPRLKGKFWIKLEYLLPLNDSDLVSLLEYEVPEQFRQPSFRKLGDALHQKTKEN